MEGLSCFQFDVKWKINKKINALFRFDRECSADIQIGDICFTKGCIVSVPIFAIHYDEKIYPEPCKFDPERYFTTSENSIHF